MPTTVTIASIADATEGGSAGTFRVSRSDTSGSLSVSLTYSGTGSGDYWADPIFVMFSNGQATADVTINALDDSTSEPTETVICTVDSSPFYTVGTPGSATITILDNDAQVVSVAKIDDPTEGGANGLFRFTRTGDLSSSLTVSYSVGGTATSGTDFTALSGTVTFTLGSATADVTVATAHDGINDPNETVIATVTSGSGYSVGSPSSATMTIADHAVPLITVAVIDDGTEGGSNGKLRLTRTDYLSNSLTVDYNVGGDATAGTDYTALSGSATFAANSATVDVTVTVTNDSTTEYDESVVLFLLENTGYALGTADDASVVIHDNETPLVRVEQTRDALEGDWDGEFWFIRAGNTSQQLTVTYSVGGTATSGTDFTALSGSVTFGAGECIAELAVDAADENSWDPNETVTVTISSGSGYVVDTANSASVTIIDSDMPFITVETIDDGEEGGDDGLLRFTRTGSTSASLTVQYTVGGDAIGEDDEDYEELTGSVTFAANSATADVAVNVTDDDDDEPLEFVNVSIDADTNYAIGDDGSAVVSIVDDELPVVTLVKVIDSAETGGNGLFRFNRTLGDLSGTLTVSYTVAGSATSGTDYTSLSGSVTFAAGASTADVVVAPIADTTSESTETVTMTLSTGSGYVRGTTSAVSMDLREETAGGVSGRMWIDTDGDGTQDGGEYGLAYGWVYLLKGDEVVAAQATETDGDYSFLGIASGTYTVLFDLTEGFDSTVSQNGEQPVTVTAGATTTDVSEGCQPKAAFTPTGKRDGIDWSTLDLSSGVAKVGVGGVKGKEYTVKTVKGTAFKVFAADPAATQPDAVKVAGFFIDTNCHGYSLNATGVTASDGRVYNFAIADQPSIYTMLVEHSDPREPADAQADHAAGKKVIVVFFNSTGGPIHSAIMTSIVRKADGTLDTEKSICNTKNGWGPEQTNVKLTTLMAFYRALPGADERLDVAALCTIK